jgi:hypothetical protein
MSSPLFFSRALLVLLARIVLRFARRAMIAPWGNCIRKQKLFLHRGVNSGL